MIRRQVEMPVTIERLWEALTDPAEMAGWFGAEVEWDLRPGGPARFRDGDGEERHGRIDDVRPGRHLRFTWWPAAQPEERSEVSYLLQPTEEGSRLTVQERRVDAPPVVIEDSVASSAWSTWDSRLLGAWGDVSMRAGASVRASA